MTDLRRAAQGNSDEVNILANFIAGRDIYTIISSWTAHVWYIFKHRGYVIGISSSLRK